MLRGRTAGFPKKLGGRASGGAGYVVTICTVPRLWHTNHEHAVSVWCSTIWSPNASETSIDKLQIVQNTALRIATGCTHDINTQHLHDETNVLPIHQHLQLHASQIRQKAQHPTHPLHKLTIHPGSNDSRLHVVEPPRGRSFIWQIGVNSSIQDQRQV